MIERGEEIFPGSLGLTISEGKVTLLLTSNCDTPHSRDLSIFLGPITPGLENPTKPEAIQMSLYPES